MKDISERSYEYDEVARAIDRYESATERYARVSATVYFYIDENDNTIEEYREGTFLAKDGFEEEDWNELSETEKLICLGYTHEQIEILEVADIEVDCIC